MTATASTLFVIVLAAAAGAQSPERAAIVFVTDEPGGAVATGARFGAEEMLRTAALLGRRLTFEESRVGTVAEVEAVARRLGESTTHAFVVLDVSPAAACEIVDGLSARERGGRPIAIVPRRADGTCTGRRLQLRLPAKAREALVKTSGEPNGWIDEWHSSLSRFGAEQLNDRFERTTGGRLDGNSWAGWFAVKVAAEAVFRLESPTFERLAGGEIVFDGHKGVPLRFAPGGLLRQPLYVIAEDGTRVLAEIAPDTQNTTEAGR